MRSFKKEKEADLFLSANENADVVLALDRNYTGDYSVGAEVPRHVIAQTYVTQRTS